ncbi:MAG: T9SS type A sorting domain-containing protein [Bacteroidetes bacterium]|nr:T9SS type A sorting domain-containing protein [Bacteroidota bacterium]
MKPLTLITLITFITFITFNLSICQSQPIITTLAGNGTPGFQNGQPDSTLFNHPSDVFRGRDGTLVADAENHCIRAFDWDLFSTFAGTGTAGFVDGPALQAQFNHPAAMCSGYKGFAVYVSDCYNHAIRMIINGYVTTIAGTGTPGYQDGIDINAQFCYPTGICTDAAGNIYVADSWNHRIRKIDTDGMVSTVAGGGNSMGLNAAGDFADGPDTSARFYTPTGICVDDSDRIFVADSYNHRIRLIKNGTVSTYAGSGPTGPGQGGHQNGNPDMARFNTPTAVCIEKYNPHYPILYISDTYNNRIRRILPDHIVYDWAGNGLAGFVNGRGDTASFDSPGGITCVSSGESSGFWIADKNNHAIRTTSIVYGSITEINPNHLIINCFPNPFSDKLQVCFNKQPGSALLCVYDIVGRIIFSKKIGSDLEINTCNWNPGIYLLMMSSGKGSKVIKKVIKI